jgi:lipoprotein-anchoring transpeptidase ErfK/SrfK
VEPSALLSAIAAMSEDELERTRIRQTLARRGDALPEWPVSHGCVRVSNEAIDWIWAQNLAPIGMKVWLY